MREMKDSGIEWVGAIPQDWQLSKIGSLYTQRNEKVSDKDYQPLSVTMQGILPQLATAAKTDDGDNRKLVRVGDFAINSRSDRRGSCGISPFNAESSFSRSSSDNFSIAERISSTVLFLNPNIVFSRSFYFFYPWICR